MKKYILPHLKLGCTSFLLQADYIPGFRFAAERCEDVALLLLTAGEKGEHLATPEDIKEIGRICDGEGTSLHIHLPTDADFDTARGARRATHKIGLALERIAPLHAHSFVLHLTFPSLQDVLLGKHVRHKGASEEQRQWTGEALRQIAALLPAPEQLAVENLESMPPTFWDQWIDNSPYSRCLDIGHIWKDHQDPVPVLEAWLPQVRIIHLHGLRARADRHAAARDRVHERPPSHTRARLLRLFGARPRDHTSLRHMPPDCLDAVMRPLWERGFSGVLCLEVFSVEDFTTSHDALMRSWERCAAAGAALP